MSTVATACSLAIIVVVLAWVTLLSPFSIPANLACGDRGGDLYVASGFRTLCISHDGVVLR